MTKLQYLQLKTICNLWELSQDAKELELYDVSLDYATRCHQEYLNHFSPPPTLERQEPIDVRKRYTAQFSSGVWQWQGEHRVDEVEGLVEFKMLNDKGHYGWFSIDQLKPIQ